MLGSSSHHRHLCGYFLGSPGVSVQWSVYRHLKGSCRLEAPTRLEALRGLLLSLPLMLLIALNPGCTHCAPVSKAARRGRGGVPGGGAGGQEYGLARGTNCLMEAERAPLNPHPDATPEDPKSGQSGRSHCHRERQHRESPGAETGSRTVKGSGGI
ncbi:hypothetical protein NDU88_001215 [Pleurodeles waltl]|uniref:Uncharacterized protein n=1 Tax=Pleurodeles waltl TaxID=8319 RepID=A0AAV7LYX2_PLEWA|nr:hypothetical protein NDU88_001215 [Pleurodeles waltl]